MLNIAICDDDHNVTSFIYEILNKKCKESHLAFNIDVFDSGERLTSFIKNNEYYDIIYLDIEMKKMNGIDTARFIRLRGVQSILIYISSYENYFIELFEVEPFRFIKKPISIEKFNNIFDLAMIRAQKKQVYFEYKHEKIITRVPYHKIVYFESNGRKILVHTINEEMDGKFNEKLNIIEENIAEKSKNFIRIHQSYYVNLLQIRDFGYAKIIMSNGDVLQISEDRRKVVRELYLSSLKLILNKD